MKINKLRLMALILVLILLLSTLSSCGNKTKNLECRKILEACLESTGENSFDTIASYGEELYNNSFSNMYAVKWDMIDDGAILYVGNGSKGDEITVLHLKENSDVSIAKDKMNDRIESRRQVFQGYSPDDIYKIENAEVIVQGNYVMLLVTEDNQKYETIIRTLISSEN